MYILSHEHKNAYYSSIPKVYDFDLSHIPLYTRCNKTSSEKDCTMSFRYEDFYGIIRLSKTVGLYFVTTY